MSSLSERRTRKPSDRKGNWVPWHEACRPPSCPVARSFSSEPCRTPEQLRPSERAPSDSAEAGAERPGARGRKKGVNFGEAERGGKGAASGGGSELRGLLSEPKRKERELSAVEGGEADRVCRQPSGARALLERRRAGRRRASEFRGAQATRNASPSTGESRERALRRQRACRQSAAFWPAGDNQASCRRRAGAPGEQATKRSGADARGGLPPLLLLRGERTYKNQRKARPGALLAAGPGGD